MKVLLHRAHRNNMVLARSELLRDVASQLTWLITRMKYINTIKLCEAKSMEVRRQVFGSRSSCIGYIVITWFQSGVNTLCLTATHFMKEIDLIFGCFCYFLEGRGSNYEKLLLNRGGVGRSSRI